MKKRKNNFDNMDNYYKENISKDCLKRNKEFTNSLIKESNFKEYNCCPITRTKDEDFIIDYHPDTERIVLYCGMSGHGFKLSNLNGKIAYDLIKRNKNKYDDMFNIDRF